MGVDKQGSLGASASCVTTDITHGKGGRCHADVVSSTRVDSDSFRLDLDVQFLEELPDGTLKCALRFNPDRYEWQSHSEHGRVLFDRNTHLAFPEAVIGEMVESMGRVPMHGPGEVLPAEELLRQRRKSIATLLDEKTPDPTLTNPAATALAAMANESRQFTVISVDLVGSTQMLAHQPEAYRRLVPVLLHEVSAIGEHFGGVLIKFTGDGVLIGFPEPAFCVMADAAFDAGCAILAVVYGVLNTEAELRGLPALAIRVGLDAHRAEVTPIGAGTAQRQLDVMGLAVSLAAKVQGAGEPGELWVGQCLYELLHHTRQGLLVEAVKDFPFVDRGDEQYRLFRLALK